MLLAESAILLKLDTFCIVLLVFHCIVISILALCTSKSNFCSLSNCHLKHLPKIKQTAPMLSHKRIPYFSRSVKRYLRFFPKNFYFPFFMRDIALRSFFLVCSATVKSLCQKGFIIRSNSPIISVASPAKPFLNLYKP